MVVSSFEILLAASRKIWKKKLLGLDEYSKSIYYTLLYLCVCKYVFAVFLPLTGNYFNW